MELIRLNLGLGLFGSGSDRRFQAIKAFNPIYDNRPNPTDNEDANDDETQGAEIIVQITDQVPDAAAQLELIFQEADCLDSSDKKRHHHGNEGNR